MLKVHVDFDRNANIKKRVKDNVEQAAVRWQNEPGHHIRYGKPWLGYVSVNHPLFMTYYLHHVCQHPKAIYRPGNTVVLVYIPYSKETVESNRGGDWPSDLWMASFFDSMHLGMYLNRVIRETFDEVGRIHSGTNAPTDWNEKTHREEWSHKLAAYAAGMGRFGIGGSFHTETGFAGRLSSILVDEHYAPFTEEELAWQDVDHALERSYTDSKYEKGMQVQVGPKAMASCPGRAITEQGIDQAKCQAFCSKINPYTPSPEVCGKCFYWDLE